MKTIIVLFALSMLALGSCETIEVERLIYDTVYVNKPGPATLVPTFITVRDTVFIRDTVEVKVVIHDTVIQEIHTTDTLIQYVTKDSLIIREVEKVVHHYDTVIQTVIDTVINNVVIHDTITETIILHDTVELMTYDRTVVYLDTLYVIAGIRPVYSVPAEIQTHIVEFYQLAGQYGRTLNGGVIIVSYVHPEDLPGENWISESFWIGGSPYGQMYIGVSESLPPEQHRASILREMNRLQLKGKYTIVPDRIMNPLFNPAATITTNHLNDLFQIKPI